MFKNIVMNRVARLVVLMVLLILLLGAWNMTNAQQTVRAADSTIQTLFACTPNQVGVFNNVSYGRVHVRCSNAYNDGGTNIYYWSYPASDSAGASRYESLFSTALVTGSTVTVYFNAGDTSGNAWGCNSSDCRRIWGATVP